MEIDFRSRPSQVGTTPAPSPKIRPAIGKRSEFCPPVFENITKGRDKTLTGETLKVSRRDFHVTATRQFHKFLNALWAKLSAETTRDGKQEE